MKRFSSNVRFKGNWRVYQERIIKSYQKALVDGKLHIVAAPGSGKTILGLEIIRRIGEPTLILSPSITIRQQWLDRFTENFLPDSEEKEEWISNALTNPKLITSTTYQALFCGLKHVKESVEETNDEFEEEEEEDSEVEYLDFEASDIINTLKEAGVKTICLDEAHHLKNEWWKSLELLIKNLPDVKIISLTATPPYDSNINEWNRYIALCGEIDEELYIPELVKEKSLCPHQDYVYLNYPTKEEAIKLSEFRNRAKKTMTILLEDITLTSAICSHKGVQMPAEYTEYFLDNPKYFTAIHVYLEYKKQDIPKELRQLTGTKAKFPSMNEEWLESILQGFLYNDTASYDVTDEYRESIENKLKAGGFLKNHTISFTNSDALNRLMVSSKGKLKSILDITTSEITSLKGELRLLILTDYIKKEFIPYIGNSDSAIDVIGVVPIFELLRRMNNPEIKLGVLSGSVVIIPKASIIHLNEIAEVSNMHFSYEALNHPDYVSVVVTNSNKNIIVSAVTKLFSSGSINTLIGTKSLLGEGWDAPCINSLILASFVGSFVSSNQMRGRAIRKLKDNPDKTSNIWHLVTVDPDDTNTLERGEFATLERRFNGFLGISYNGNSIENGLDRLEILKPPFFDRNIKIINANMLCLATDRKKLYNQWQQSIDNYIDMSAVIERTQVIKKNLKKGYSYYNALAAIIMGILTETTLIINQIGSKLRWFDFFDTMSFKRFLLISSLIAFIVGKYGYKLVTKLTPQGRYHKVTLSLLNALVKSGYIKSAGSSISSTEIDKYLIDTYLTGGTLKEMNLYTGCLVEFYSVIDNPKYILLEKTLFGRKVDYYPVPEILSRHKDTAENLLMALNQNVGKFELVYTRNVQGKRLLLKARMEAYENISARLLKRKQAIMSKWE